MSQKMLHRLLTALFVSFICTVPLTATDSINIRTSVDAVCCATPPAKPVKKEKKKKAKKDGKKKSSEKENTSNNSAEL